jgi:nuclear pore complex protein Nup155
MVLDRYNACQTVAFCGYFSQINRAWASVDNSLFLWRHDRWQDIPIEYSGEEQAIVAVGIAKPRQGVFVEAIQYILIVCTTTHIRLLGVCCSPGPSHQQHDGGGLIETSTSTPSLLYQHDAFFSDIQCEEITLQSLPLYVTSSDNITMVCITSTAKGEIYLGGADGHLYELQYAVGERWRQKRCTKVCHTGGIRGFLPSFVPAFLFGAPAALVDLKVDDEKGVLYARTSTSGIQVFDLGRGSSTSGTTTNTSSTSHVPKKVAECTDFLADASRAPINGREVFGRGGGDKRGASVVYMSPIPSSDSSRLHFLTVTADGRRVYWSVASPARLGRTFPRPERLRAEVARQAVPSSALIQQRSAAAGGGGGGMMMMANRSSGAGVGGRSLEVVAAHYSNGCLLLAEASPASSSSSSFIAAAAPQPQQQQQQQQQEPRRTRLFLLTRDLTIPPVGTATGAHIGVQGLRENVSELEMMTSLPGEACAISNSRSLFLLNTATGNKSGGGGVRDDATSLNFTPAPRFVVVTTAGVVETERQRPVDILGQLLEEKVSGGGAAAKIDMFFKSYGAAEAAAMCISLASGGTPAGGGGASSSASLSARAVLEDVRLVGEPILYDSTGAITTDLSAAAAAAADSYQQQDGVGGTEGGWYASAFDMGAPVPVAEPDWSGAHKGLALHVSRMLSNIWDESVAVPATSTSTSGSGGGQVVGVSSTRGRDGLLKCRFPGDVLAGLEARLRSLDAWLGEYLVRKKARQQQHETRGYHNYSIGDSGGGGGGGQQQGDQHQQQMNGHYHHPAPDGLPTPSAKRQRLMEDATRQEIAKCETIRALVSRAAQGCFLLRVLSEHNLGRLAARAEESHRMALQSIKFRDWVASQEGEAVAAALVSVLVAEHLHATGGVAEDLAAALASGCPAYFREEDKTFYQASGLLQRAEAAGTMADREALIQEAVTLMSRVPLVVDLGQVVPQLAHLHAMHAVVDLTARKAAAIDPSNLAANAVAISGHASGHASGAADTDSDGGEVAHRKRYNGCYQHVIAVLRVLCSSSPLTIGTGTGSGGAMILNGTTTTTTSANATASLESFEKSLTSPAEKETLKHSLLSRLMIIDDRFFHEAIFSAVMKMVTSSSHGTDTTGVSIKDLIALESPYLEPYLIRAGGLEGAATATSSSSHHHHHQKTKIGPLSTTQAAHADALARLYISRDQYGAAARVYELLAERMAAPGEADVSLTDRVSSLQRAILQARSCGDGSLLDRLESKSRVMVLQSTMVAVLEKTLGESCSTTHNGGEGEQQQQVYMEQLKAAISELSSEPKELAELYNDYAVPLCLWKLCLEAIDISGYGDAGYVEQLWDLFLKETWHRALPSSGTTAATATATATATAELCLELCCREVEALGEKFYPNENSFPTTHITMRLESTAEGHWPSPGFLPSPSANISSINGGDVLGGGGSRVARALVKACKGGAEAVVRVYEELLTSPGGGGGGQEADGGGGDDGSKEMLLQSSEFRLRLLKSAFVVTLAARESVSNKAAIAGTATSTAASGGGVLRAGGRREASLLAAACDGFVAESRRLVGMIMAAAAGGGGEEVEDVERLSVEFEALRKSVSGLLGYSRW